MPRQPTRPSLPARCPPRPLARLSPPPQVRDWYVESFKELRSFPAIRDAGDELRFTEMLRGIYRRWGGEGGLR